MSVRSVSVSWGSNDSFQGDDEAQDGNRQCEPLQKSAHNSTAFYSFNATNSLYSEPGMNNNNVSVREQSAARTASDKFGWLRPWRTPQDAREGGLALLYSMQEILFNVQRARLSSVNELYAPLRSNTNSNHNNVSGSVSQRNTQLLDKNATSSSPTLRLSMRNSRQQSRPTNTVTVEKGSEVREVRNGSLTSEAATLMDYILPGSSSRQTSHMWLDDTKALQQFPPHAPAAASTATDEIRKAGKGKEEERSAKRIPSRRERSLSLLDRVELASDQQQETQDKYSSLDMERSFALSEAMHPAPQRATAVERVDHPASLAPFAQEEQRHKDVVKSERKAKSAPLTGIVPPIPRFEELKAEQEASHQRQQVQQPHPRSEAAQRKTLVLMHSSDVETNGSNNDNDNSYDGDDTSYDKSPHANPQATARLAPGTGNGTARPSAPLKADVNYNDDTSTSGSWDQLAENDEPEKEDKWGKESYSALTDGDDEVSDNMSATNFGEGGHLACVPGDTLNNRYTLLKPLGVGRSSRVWLAADLEQCSLARRQLIRALGEREARRLFRPSERPVFVAIKVFRCSAMYTDCATYEAKLSAFVKDTVRLRQVRGLCSPLSQSFSLVVSPTSRQPGNSSVSQPIDSGSFGSVVPAAAQNSSNKRSRANSDIPLTASPPQALMSSPSTCGCGPGSITATAAFSNAGNFGYTNSTTTATTTTHPSKRLTTFRDAFTVEGPYGTHQCLVMDVLGSGVEKAINETHLAGFPSEVARSIMLSSLQGLSVLAACNVIHTDLKPENLLFTDLEAEVAAEMRAFQSSQLQTGQRSGLWSSFTHKRENVLEYSRRRYRERASPAGLPRHCNNDHNSNSERHSTVSAREEKVEKDNVDDADVAHSGPPSSSNKRTRNISNYCKGDNNNTAEPSTHDSLSNSCGVKLLMNTRPPHTDDTVEGSGSLRHSHSDHNHHYLEVSHSSGKPVRGQSVSEGHSSNIDNHHRTYREGDVVAATEEGSECNNGDNGNASGGPGSSNLTSPLPSSTHRGCGSTVLLPLRPRCRPAYEVCVTDFGLSFITPPCLRLGVRAMARYTEDVGISEDDLVHDDALSQLEWLYEQQHSAAESSSNATHIGVGGDVGVTTIINPNWSPEGCELIDEAELRVLQLEEARAGDELVRRKSDVVDRAADRDADVENSYDEERDGNVKEDEEAGKSNYVTLSQPSTAPAVEFTSVMDVGVAAKTQQRTPKKKSQRFQHQHAATQPDHTHLTDDCSIHHSNNSSGSNSTSDSLHDDRVTATHTADSSEMDHLGMVAPATPAPPIALRTASYHSPVSHPLTVLPNITRMSSGPQPPHREELQNDNEEEVVVKQHGGVGNQSSLSSPRLSPCNLFHSRTCQEYYNETDAVEELHAVSSPTYVTAPKLLCRSSPAVSEEAENTTNSSTRPKPFERSSAQHHPLLPDPSVGTNALTSVTSDTSKEENDEAMQQGKQLTFVSPRQHHHPQRHSTISALASLTALRRLELDIIRNQRYSRGVTIQSREYRAPEVLLGNFFLPSCDIWSMGCIAYELVTGQFLIDCIADRERFGRQLTQHVRQEQRQEKGACNNNNNSRHDYPEDEDEDVEWDGQPIYVDDHEQDLDVFHLKAIMRLIGPPPISFLKQRPIGLFVDDYFDTNGNFKFWEEGEAKKSGMDLADPYRRQELRYYDRQRRDSGGGSNNGGLPVYFQSNHTNDLCEEDVYENRKHNESYVDVDRVNDEDVKTVTGGKGLREAPRVRSFGSPCDVSDLQDPSFHPPFAAEILAASNTHGSAAAAADFYLETDQRGTPSSDTTPSTIFTTPSSYIKAPMGSYVRGELTSATTHPSALPGGDTSSLTPLPPPQQQLLHASPHDTSNYPIETPHWVEMREAIRRKLNAAEEARDFEHFLWRCLQWDPAQRATAAELLAENWMVKYSYKIAETVDSDAETEEGDVDVATAAV